MKAVILVGGEATRLRPLTHNTPKAMVPVVNTPFLGHVTRHLASHQIVDVILAQGHLAKSIERFLGDGSQYGVKLSYATEDSPLGSAGAAKYAVGPSDESCLVMNGDIISDLNFTAMVAFHQQRQAKVTIAVIAVHDPTSYGLVETTTKSRVTRFLEKPKPEEVTTNWVNAGAWIVEPDILAQIPPNARLSFERDVFPKLLDQREPVYAYQSSGYWMDVGTPEKYAQLHWDILDGKCQLYQPAQTEDVLMGDNTFIHISAEIRGPVVIGAECSIGRQAKLTGPVVIGDKCVILEDSTIEKTIIWRNTHIGPGARIINSIIADNCYLNADCTCQDAVLSDNVTVNSGYVIEPGSKVEPGTVLGY